MIFALLSFLPAARSAEDRAALALAETERAFARMSVNEGVRASFLTYFADDGLLFNPDPVNGRSLMSGRPKPMTKPPFTLDWQPDFVRVSRSGDYGISTGRTQVTTDPGAPEARAPKDGHYLSIWKKQSDRAWKVAFDFGANGPASGVSEPVAAPFDRVSGSDRNRNTPAEFAKLNAEFTPGRPPRFAADARLYVEGEPAAFGAKAATAAWLNLPRVLRYEPVGTDLAASGDLGVTYGRLFFESGTLAPKAAWTMHVWQRDEPRGEWQVIAASCQAPSNAKP